jgi:hypothetical protein
MGVISVATTDSADFLPRGIWLAPWLDPDAGCGNLRPPQGQRHMENRHPVDELAAIREERRRLAEREQILRMRLLKPGADLVGEGYVASVSSFERAELDRAKLEAHFGSAIVAACEKTTTYKIVSLCKRARQWKAPARVNDVVEAP